MKPIFNDKHLDTLALALRPDTISLTLEGTIRSTKTVIAIQVFYYVVKTSPDFLHCISAKDYDAIRDNILICNGLGLMQQFSDVVMEKDKIGGYFLSTYGIDGQKKMILLAGYEKANQWEKILGKTIGCFLIDECDTASERFIDETYARQASADRPFRVQTLNGNVPTHFIYVKYINRSKPLFKVPQSILNDMVPVENEKGWYYIHWTMEDNPIMTPEKIERASSIYPVGSYYHTIKILGERGAPEGAIFAQYLNEEFYAQQIEVLWRGQKQYVNEIEYNLASGKYIAYCFGLDLGNNNVKRGTILTFSALTYGFKNFDIIDTYQCESNESQDLVFEICEQMKKWYDEIQNVGVIDSLRIDGFGSIEVLVPTIRKQLRAMGMSYLVDQAIKFGESGGRKARLTLFLQLVSRHTIRFNKSRKGSIECMKQFRKLSYNPDDGLPLDLNQLEMDYYDSAGYSITPFTNKLTNALR